MAKSRAGKKVKRNLALEEPVDDVIASAGNASRYIAALVIDARSEWRDALSYLIEAGLDRSKIKRLVSDIDAMVRWPWRGDMSSLDAATSSLVREWRRGNTELQRSLE